MAGASVEATLELWARSLRDVKGRMRPLFTQERVATSAGVFLDGLLGEERRKTGWTRAEAAGDPGPWRQQAILGGGRWNADDLRDIVHEYALGTLAGDDDDLAETERLVVGRRLIDRLGQRGRRERERRKSQIMHLISPVHAVVAAIDSPYMAIYRACIEGEAGCGCSWRR